MLVVLTLFATILRGPPSSFSAALERKKEKRQEENERDEDVVASIVASPAPARLGSPSRRREDDETKLTADVEARTDEQGERG